MGWIASPFPRRNRRLQRAEGGVLPRKAPAGLHLRREYPFSPPLNESNIQTVNHLACGGIDNTVSIFDLETKAGNKLGTHSSAVRCLEYNAKGDVLVSGGWDATIKVRFYLSFLKYCF